MGIDFWIEALNTDFSEQPKRQKQSLDIQNTLNPLTSPRPVEYIYF